MPWLYVYAGAPSMTHRRVRQILDTLYHDTADGLPATEGYGQLSAWYVLAAMGLYPVDPVGGVYVLGSPIFDEVEIDVGDGRTFRIEANNAFVYPYVVGARLNGDPWPYTWITKAGLVVECQGVRGSGGPLLSRPLPSPGGIDRARTNDLRSESATSLPRNGL